MALLTCSLCDFSVKADADKDAALVMSRHMRLHLQRRLRPEQKPGLVWTHPIILTGVVVVFGVVGSVFFRWLME